MNAMFLGREMPMQASKIMADGSAREEALKRRNEAMRESLRLRPARRPEANGRQETKADEKPSE
jgi:hypothetical protein